MTAAAQHKVLLIDDSEISLHFVAGVLSRAGYDVRTADDVDKLEGVLGDWRPDVILTDVNMPGISGLELCRMLKANYETAHVPVVLFSAMPNSELEGMARDCEADGYLSKSNGLEKLPKELAMMIETTLF
ncbi:MAG TPA: response regulator [Kofleriaceae bacterium]|jgi:CheY-like chemotaxis protein|nr:response regulator [Kofleriaceae bacterium]